MKLTEYIKKNTNIWILIFLWNCLCHASMLLSSSIGIDTEDIITLKDLFYGGWLETGRQGLVLLKLLTDTYTFNPYLSGMITLIMLTAAGIMWTYLFTYISGRENKAAIVSFSMLLTVSTIFTEQMYFKLQCMEISIALVLMAVSLLMICKKKYVISFMLNLVLFSVYQVMVALFIFGASACIFISCFCTFNNSDKEKATNVWKKAVGFLTVFVISFLTNQIITACFFSGSDYLASQIGWFTNPFGVCVANIVQHIKEVLFGMQIYYVKTFSIYCFLMLAAVVFILIKEKKQRTLSENILAVLSLVLLYLSPFYMTLLCGQAPVMRSQLVLPFTVAFMSYALFLLVQKYKNIYSAKTAKITWTVLLLIGFMTGYLQLKYTMQLNYTDSVRYASDVRVAESMIDRIDSFQNEERSLPVVVIGSLPAQLNNSCIRGEVIGYSFFEWDTQVEPYGYFNTRRVLGFMHTLGVNYRQGDMEQTQKALEYSQNMSCWPTKDYVELYDDIIIVKLN